MAASRKRGRDYDLQIKTAAGQPVEAEALIARTFSSVARGLPADAVEWDVSGLLLDGEPYRQETVKCWLAVGNSTVYGAAELDAEDIQQLSSLKQLYEVLSFSHAVGSPEGLLKAACSQLDSLKVTMQLPEKMLEMPLTGHYIYEIQPNALQHYDSQASTIYDFASEQQLKEVQLGVATQLGRLLCTAHMLRLQPLLDRLHGFIFDNAQYDPTTINGIEVNKGVLYGVLELVMTDAVLDAALGSSTIGRGTYINSVLTQPCSLTAQERHCCSLFKPVGPIKFVKSQPEQPVLQFLAQLTRDLDGFSAGSSVQVELHLFSGNPSMQIASKTGQTSGYCNSYPLHLLLGTHIGSPEDMAAVMRSELQS